MYTIIAYGIMRGVWLFLGPLFGLLLLVIAFAIYTNLFFVFGFWLMAYGSRYGYGYLMGLFLPGDPRFFRVH